MKKNLDYYGLFKPNSNWHKFILTMKISAFLLFCCLVNIIAAPTYSQATKISLNLKDATIEEVLNKIEDVSEFYFLYNQKLIDVTRKVNIEADKEPIEDILNDILNKDTKFIVYDRQIILTPSDVAALSATLQQQLKITGTVTDKDGTHLPGVNVVVTGTTQGTLTDVTGKYIINIPQGSKSLTFTFIGMQPQEISIGALTQIDVTMTESAIGLDEVVVVGYGIQKRANVVGAVTSISGASLASIPSPSVSNAISGRLPGSIVIQESGEPGNLGTRILVRGRSTLSDTGPLVVIDGITGRSMYDIDPMDISSLSVLKDASAAIYGAQAANGVILITTKKGKEGKPRLNYQFYQGLMTPTIVPESCNAAEYATMISEFEDENNKTRTYSDADIALYKSGADPWLHPNTDWMGDLIKKWTTSFKHTITLEGGSKGVLYYVSLGLRGDESFYKQSSTNYKQYNVRTKLEIPITDWLKVGIDIAGFQNKMVYPVRSAVDLFGYAPRLLPTTWSFWPNGLPGPDIESGDNPVVTSTFQAGKDQQTTYKIQSTYNVTITPPFVKGLSMNANFSYDVDNFYRKRFWQPWTLYYPNLSSATIDPVSGFITDMDLIPTLRGIMSPEDHEDYSRSIKTTGNINVSYNKTFGDHTVSFYGGYEQYADDYNNFYAFRKYYISSLVQTLDAGADLDKNNSGGISIYARKSWIARATYDYKGKYLAEVLFRRDGSLKFPPDSRWGNFPGLLLGWRTSEEGFWKNNIPFVNYFKLRASYGVMGMDPGSSFQYMNKFSLTNGLTLGTDKVLETTVAPSSVANPVITWETQTTRNIGFDSKWLNDMLHLNADFFYNKRDHILATRFASVPDFTGLSLPDENIARVDNKGFEIEGGFHKVINSDFRFDITANFSKSHNKVVFMDEPERVVPWQVRTGHPYGATLLYNAIGIFKDDAAVAAYPHWPGAQPGDVIFEDVNGDGIINADDKILLDFTDAPEVFYGATLDATYKDFSLSVLFQGQGKYMPQGNGGTTSGGRGNYPIWYYINHWTPTNTVTDVARPWNRDDYYWSEEVQNSTYWYYNMAYLRLKNLVLTYNIPSQLYKRLGISKASVYFSGNNLALVWAAQRNYDPEIASPLQYPAMKTFAFGANITF